MNWSSFLWGCLSGALGLFILLLLWGLCRTASLADEMAEKAHSASGHASKPTLEQKIEEALRKAQEYDILASSLRRAAEEWQSLLEQQKEQQ